MSHHPSESVQQLSAQTRYPVAAFHFVQRGLDYTVRRLHKHPERLTEEKRHVTGRQLSLGLREFALQQYGHLARAVLHHWGIRGTEDFGNIVFAMVREGLMSATDTDTPRDFDSVYPFDDSFELNLRLDRVLTANHDRPLVEAD